MCQRSVNFRDENSYGENKNETEKHFKHHKDVCLIPYDDYGHYKQSRPFDCLRNGQNNNNHARYCDIRRILLE